MQRREAPSGSALLAGAGGRALFGVAGSVAMIPLLRRLRRHTGNWRVLGLALAGFVAIYLLSTLIVGPAIDVVTSPDAATPPPGRGEVDHHGHDVTGGWAMLASVPPPPITALDLGPVRLTVFGLVVAIAVLVGVNVTRRRYEAAGGDPELVDRVLFPAILTYLGARLAYVVTNTARFQGDLGAGTCSSATSSPTASVASRWRCCGPARPSVCSAGSSGSSTCTGGRTETATRSPHPSRQPPLKPALSTADHRPGDRRCRSRPPKRCGSPT